MQASGLTFAHGTLILGYCFGLESLGFNKSKMLFPYFDGDFA